MSEALEVSGSHRDTAGPKTDGPTSPGMWAAWRRQESAFPGARTGPQARRPRDFSSAGATSDSCAPE